MEKQREVAEVADNRGKLVFFFFTKYSLICKIDFHIKKLQMCMLNVNPLSIMFLGCTISNIQKLVCLCTQIGMASSLCCSFI